MQIISPSNISYSLNQAVVANYSCSDSENAVSECEGPVPNGANIDTATIGPHSFTVTATNSNGNSTQQTIDYVVVPMSPASVSFGPQFIGTPSAASSVVLTNPNSTPLDLSAITTEGDFYQSNRCPASLAPNASCAILVQFRPRSAGPLNGRLMVTAGGGQFPVNLSGTGTQAKLSVSILGFRRGVIGSMSGWKKLFLVNDQDAPLNIGGMSMGGDFIAKSYCGSYVAPHSRCRISVAFMPRAAGSEGGWLMLNANSPIAPQTVKLIGFATDRFRNRLIGGQGRPPD